jgi:HD-like signal output (HDOD) protein
MLYEQFEELKHSGKLPTPSGIGLRILVLTRSEECSITEIAQTLQADPALTGRILKLANSAVSAGVQPATNVRDAGVRLGLRTVCNVALGFSLVNGNRTGRCQAFDYDAYWSWSLASAVSAELLSRELRLGTPGEAFTLGLLARVGRLALASVHPELYAEVLGRLQANRTLDLALLERETFCINHREVGAAVAEDWGLPAMFGEVMLHSGVRIPETFDWPESRQYLELLVVAGNVADVLLGGAEAGALWPAARESLVRAGVAQADCQRLYDEIGDQWREWGQLLQVPAPYGQQAAQLEHAPPASIEPADDALRILVVDDEPTSLRIVASLLERKGHRVKTARNGQVRYFPLCTGLPQ